MTMGILPFLRNFGLIDNRRVMSQFRPKKDNRREVWRVEVAFEIKSFDQSDNQLINDV